MFKKVAAWTAVVLLALVSLAIVAAIFFSESSVGATLASGRQISATVDSFMVSMETDGEKATIRTPRLTIVVTPAKITVDGQTVATLPDAAKSVAVTVKRGKVTCLADGKRVDGPPPNR